MKYTNTAYMSPPRTHGTPSGYRNVRVLVPRDLHFRLSSYASQSHLSMPAFVVAWLNLATPLAPSPSPQGQQTAEESAPGHRPCRDLQEAHGLAIGPSAAQEQQEPAPCPRPAQVPLCVTGEAKGPGAAPSPTAWAQSSPDLTADPHLARSSATIAPVESSSSHELDQAQAGGQGHA